jgi:hypothetical protein
MCDIQRLNRQDKKCKCLWTEYGSSSSGTSLCQELQRCWVFQPQQFPVCIKNGPPHPDNLTQLWVELKSTWASITVERFRHLVVSMPCRIETVLRGCNNIRKVFSPILCLTSSSLILPLGTVGTFTHTLKQIFILITFTLAWKWYHPRMVYPQICAFKWLINETPGSLISSFFSLPVAT